MFTDGQMDAARWHYLIPFWNELMSSCNALNVKLAMIGLSEALYDDWGTR